MSGVVTYLPRYPGITIIISLLHREGQPVCSLVSLISGTKLRMVKRRFISSNKDKLVEVVLMLKLMGSTGKSTGEV